jgi:hypothetical protein
LSLRGAVPRTVRSEGFVSPESQGLLPSSGYDSAVGVDFTPAVMAYMACRIAIGVFDLWIIGFAVVPASEIQPRCRRAWDCGAQEIVVCDSACIRVVSTPLSYRDLRRLCVVV